MKNEMEDSQLQNNAIEENETPYSFTIKQAKVLKALKACGGTISHACENAGCNRMSFYNWYNGIPAFRDEVDAINEAHVDFAESQLMFLMKGQYVYRKKLDSDGKPIEGQFEIDAEGNPIRDYITPIDNASVIFKLKTKGKDRGYTYKKELAVSTAVGGFEIRIRRPKKADEQ